MSVMSELSMLKDEIDLLCTEEYKTGENSFVIDFKDFPVLLIKEIEYLEKMHNYVFDYVGEFVYIKKGN